MFNSLAPWLSEPPTYLPTTVKAQPPGVLPFAQTDLVLGWQDGQHPSTRAFSLAQLGDSLLSPVNGDIILTTNSRIGLDTAAFGGVPNMYMRSNGGEIIFHAGRWNEFTPSAFRGINFKVFGNGGADEYWGATGGPNGNGATLKVYSVTGGQPCIGSILASNEGQLMLGNDTGTILNIQGPTGDLTRNSIRILGGGTGVPATISVTGEPGCDLGLTSLSYGSTVIGNSNGPSMVIADGSTGAAAHTGYFVFTASIGGAVPSMAVSTAGVLPPVPDLSMSISARGGGDIIMGNGNGPTVIISDPTSAGQPRQTYLKLSGTTSAGNAGITMTTAGIASPPTVASFFIAALGNGAVVLGNANGPTAVFNDGGALATPRESYLVFSAGVSGIPPVLALSTAGVASPPTDVSLHMKAIGAGGFLMENATNNVFVRAGTGGNLILGGPTGLAANATSGFIQIPSCVGPPTGVPANASGGITLVYEAAANKLWSYNGAWRSAAFT